MKPLPIWAPEPSGDILAALRAAKAQIHTDILITPVKAVPGSPGRVLAFGSPPPWLCDYALIGQVVPERIKPALEWALGLREDDRPMTVLRKMQQIFGSETREVNNEHAH